MLEPAFWDEYMKLYDRGVGGLEPYRALLKRLVAASQPAEGAVIIDAGCGTGNVIAEVLRVQPNVKQIVGLERDEAAVRLAREKFAGNVRVRIEQVDINGTEWPDMFAHVDLVYSCNVVYTLFEPELFVRQIASLLRKGGKFVVTNPFVPKPERVWEAHELWLETEATEKERRKDREHFLPARRRLIAMNQIIVQEAAGNAAHFLRKDVWEDMLFRCGLHVLAFEEGAYEGVNILFVAQKL